MDADIVALATSVRHTIHANPELGFQEFHTQALVRDTLLTAGVSPECIRVTATTGLVVDIAGRYSLSLNQSCSSAVGGGLSLIVCRKACFTQTSSCTMAVRADSG